MNYDFYLFDLDGTLLDLGNIGVHADRILVETLKKHKVDRIPNRSERRELWFSGVNFQEVLKNWGIFDSDNFWKSYDKTDFEIRKILLKNNKISLFKDVKTVLELIHNHKENIKLAICTNTANYIVDYFLKHFKIDHYFHEIFSMGVEANQQFAKPSPKGILIILKKFNFNPSEKTAIMIGDSIHDITAAEKAKISSCLINRNNANDFKRYKKWKIQPTYVIRQLNELLHL
ncbi:MAG: HAD family hydrolase [Promethearchaeota archaeon]